MSQCGKSIEEALKAVAANCLSLVSLNRSECCKPAHEALNAVTASCSCLASLAVNSCWQLTDEG